MSCSRLTLTIEASSRGDRSPCLSVGGQASLGSSTASAPTGVHSPAGPEHGRALGLRHAARVARICFISDPAKQSNPPSSAMESFAGRPDAWHWAIASRVGDGPVDPQFPLIEARLAGQRRRACCFALQQHHCGDGWGRGREPKSSPGELCSNPGSRSGRAGRAAPLHGPLCRRVPGECLSWRCRAGAGSSSKHPCFFSLRSRRDAVCSATSRS